MSCLALFSNRFCNAASVTEQLQKETGYEIISDRAVADIAASLCNLPQNAFHVVFTSDTMAFNPFTLEKETLLAGLKLAVAAILQEKPCIFPGHTSMVAPRRSDALRIGLTAPRPYRLSMAKVRQGLSGEEAAACIREDESACSSWQACSIPGASPWSPEIFDLVLQMDHQGAAEAARQILSLYTLRPVPPPAAHRQAGFDFSLEARLEYTAASRGYHVRASVHEGRARVLLTRPAVMRTRLEEEIKDLAQTIPGIISVEMDSRNHPVEDCDPPQARSRILLVDDEREFVQTLSERLDMRDLASDVVFDAKSALAKLTSAPPDVMVVDLKMPGMDGMALLREVKSLQPRIQVIILTGHGSDQDRRTCLDMGAFAYFQKPVDIDLLSQALKNARTPAPDTGP